MSEDATFDGGDSGVGAGGEPGVGEGSAGAGLDDYVELLDDDSTQTSSAHSSRATPAASPSPSTSRGAPAASTSRRPPTPASTPSRGGTKRPRSAIWDHFEKTPEPKYVQCYYCDQKVRLS